MKAVSGREFCKLIEGKDWGLRRINGSHHIYSKTGENARISVPVHGDTPLKIGLQRHLMKVAVIKEVEL